jgi:hypothetical protein
MAEIIYQNEEKQDEIMDINPITGQQTQFDSMGKQLYSVTDGQFFLNNSVILDKISRFAINFSKFSSDEIMLMTCFENPGIWNDKTGSVGSSILAAALLWITLGADAVSGHYYQMGTKTPWAGASMIDWTLNSFFQTTVYLSKITNQLAYIVCGGLLPLNAHQCYGFEINDATLYAMHNNATVVTKTEIVGIDVDETHVYRAEFDAINKEIRFYIDGILKATHTTNLPGLPFSEFEEGLFYYYLKTNENVTKEMDMHDLLIAITRPH